LALDPQTKVEIDDLITFVQTSGVRLLVRSIAGPRGWIICATKLAKAGDRVKTTDEFITAICRNRNLLKIRGGVPKARLPTFATAFRLRVGN
jgi:hypothetical protein